MKPYRALAVSLRAFCLESRTALCASWSEGTLLSAARVAARAFMSAARIDGRMPFLISGLTNLAPAAAACYSRGCDYCYKQLEHVS